MQHKEPRNDEEQEVRGHLMPGPQNLEWANLKLAGLEKQLKLHGQHLLNWEGTARSAQFQATWKPLIETLRAVLEAERWMGM